MKATVTENFNPLRQKFNAGELIITGSGSVSLLLADFDATVQSIYKGGLLKAGEGVGAVDMEGKAGNYTVKTGAVRLFTGKITLEN